MRKQIKLQDFFNQKKETAIEYILRNICTLHYTPPPMTKSYKKPYNTKIVTKNCNLLS